MSKKCKVWASRIIVMIIALCIVLSLVGCKKDKDKDEEKSKSGEDKVTTVEVTPTEEPKEIEMTFDEFVDEIKSRKDSGELKKEISEYETSGYVKLDMNMKSEKLNLDAKLDINAQVSSGEKAEYANINGSYDISFETPDSGVSINMKSDDDKFEVYNDLVEKQVYYQVKTKILSFLGMDLDGGDVWYKETENDTFADIALSDLFKEDTEDTAEDTSNVKDTETYKYVADHVKITKNKETGEITLELVCDLGEFVAASKRDEDNGKIDVGDTLDNIPIDMQEDVDASDMLKGAELRLTYKDYGAHETGNSGFNKLTIGVSNVNYQKDDTTFNLNRFEVSLAKAQLSEDVVIPEEVKSNARDSSELTEKMYGGDDPDPYGYLDDDNLYDSEDGIPYWLKEYYPSDNATFVIDEKAVTVSAGDRKWIFDDSFDSFITSICFFDDDRAYDVKYANSWLNTDATTEDITEWFVGETYSDDKELKNDIITAVTEDDRAVYINLIPDEYGSRIEILQDIGVEHFVEIEIEAYSTTEDITNDVLYDLAEQFILDIQ